MNIGQNIRTLRTRAGMTQEQLAGQLGVTYQAVSRWETGANTPDISLLPALATVFGVSIDALFNDQSALPPLSLDHIPDDDTIRVIQLRGRRLIDVAQTLSPDCPPIEIAFPRNCNDATQYFKVEVHGHVIADGSINGDVVAHMSVNCADINGTVHCQGDISARDINSLGDIHCATIKDCRRISCRDLHAAGEIRAASITHSKMNDPPTLM
ncbi:MAG: helix-turn-helix transcriptional regulator [Clostridia bacterium]|nr:helix-turn-helix transcriptional regulator [Clostridia bacterium]